MRFVFGKIWSVVESRPIGAFAMFYFVLMTAISLAMGHWLSTAQLFILALAPIVLLTRMRFLREMAPFIVLLLGYEFLRGLAPLLGMEVNVVPMIQVDRFLFGTLPTVALQGWLYRPGAIGPLDYLCTALYLSHVVAPLVFSSFLWLRDRVLFRHFVVTLVVLSYVGFITYALYPAMPPWMAAQRGVIAPVRPIFDLTMAAIGGGQAATDAWGLVRANPVAAMPSLHAAYPMLIWIYLLALYGRRAIPAAVYPATVWFAVVYTGNHYVIDVIVGALYAVVVFVGVEALRRCVPTPAPRRSAQPSHSAR